MRNRTISLILPFALCLITLVSCGGGDDNNNPTTPTLDSNVSGTWLFSGIITSNTCTWRTDRVIGAEGNTSISITQSGANLTGIIQGGTILSKDGKMAGKVNGNAFGLGWKNPVLGTTNNCTWSYGAGTDVVRTSNAGGTGSVNITYDMESGDCSKIALPCQIVWTGSWMK